MNFLVNFIEGGGVKPPSRTFFKEVNYGTRDYLRINR